MKKLIISLVLVFMLSSVDSFAQEGGGLFQKGPQTEDYCNREDGFFVPMMPIVHGDSGDFSGNGTPSTPIGSAVAMLVCLGTAYLMVKKRREE